MEREALDDLRSPFTVSTSVDPFWRWRMAAADPATTACFLVKKPIPRLLARNSTVAIMESAVDNGVNGWK
jgi:hypothetical protein